MQYTKIRKAQERERTQEKTDLLTLTKVYSQNSSQETVSPIPCVWWNSPLQPDMLAPQCSIVSTCPCWK